LTDAHRQQVLDLAQLAVDARLDGEYRARVFPHLPKELPCGFPPRFDQFPLFGVARRHWEKGGEGAGLVGGEVGIQVDRGPQRPGFDADEITLVEVAADVLLEVAQPDRVDFRSQLVEQFHIAAGGRGAHLAFDEAFVFGGGAGFDWLHGDFAVYLLGDLVEEVLLGERAAVELCQVRFHPGAVEVEELEGSLLRGGSRSAGEGDR
jgi:hypothetical protein